MGNIDIPSITFETKCWEGDWKKVIDNYEIKLNRNRYEFTKKWLFINNVNDYNTVIKYAHEKLIDTGIIDRYIIVEMYAKDALKHFNLTMDSFTCHEDKNGWSNVNGYYYSISELVSAYLCETKYLLHYSGDVILSGNVDWLSESINLLEYDDTVKVIHPNWEVTTSVEMIGFPKDPFKLGENFCDQCYLMRSHELKNPEIYKEKNKESGRIFADYAGETFEKMIGAWLTNHNFKRMIYKWGWYFHPSYDGRIIEDHSTDKVKAFKL